MELYVSVEVFRMTRSDRAAAAAATASASLLTTLSVQGSETVWPGRLWQVAKRAHSALAEEDTAAAASESRQRKERRIRRKGTAKNPEGGLSQTTVSYTHLTLPTICSV